MNQQKLFLYSTLSTSTLVEKLCTGIDIKLCKSIFITLQMLSCSYILQHIIGILKQHNARSIIMIISNISCRQMLKIESNAYCKYLEIVLQPCFGCADIKYLAEMSYKDIPYIFLRLLLLLLLLLVVNIRSCVVSR